MYITENRIRDIEYSHWSYMLKTLSKYGYYPCLGRITVTIHVEDVQEGGGTSSSIVTAPASNDEMKLLESVRVLIFDAHHRYESMVELINGSRPMFELSIIHSGFIWTFTQKAAHFLPWTLWITVSCLTMFLKHCFLVLSSFQSSTTWLHFQGIQWGVICAFSGG